jgi:hypothetical protein
MGDQISDGFTAPRDHNPLPRFDSPQQASGVIPQLS